MFDKLVDILLEAIRLFQFCTVLAAYQSGVRLRLGKFSKVLGPGLHFYLPFWIDTVLFENSVVETMKVKAQSLTTKDGQEIVVSSVITFRIEDIKTFLLDVEGRNNIVEDSAYGVTSNFIMKHTYAELMALDDIGVDLAKAVRRQAKKYGVDIQAVQLVDFARCSSVRLIQSSISQHPLTTL